MKKDFTVKKITIVVSVELYSKILALAKNENRSMNKQIIRIIEKYLEQNID
jgi:predicted DNA-binding protein